MKELIERIKTAKPAFFVKLQVIAGIVFAVATMVVSLPALGVNVPENIINISEQVMGIAIASGLIAQLPKKDSTQK